MCGATSAQKDLQKEQAAFYKKMTDTYDKTYAGQKLILDKLTSVFMPIIERGRSQRGMTPEMKTALETKATETVSGNYAEARHVLGDQLAARGGDDFIPSGADTQLQSGILRTAAADRAAQSNRIELADWQMGEENFDQAAGILGGVAHEMNPTGTASVANDAGGQASKTANDIAQASNSMWSAVIGGLSGVAGAAVGGWTTPKPAPAAAH